MPRACVARHLGAAAIVLAAACLAIPAAAGDAAAGRKLALKCQTCHGLDGMAKIPGSPHIAGQVEEYLVKSMTDYKTGARKNEMMSVVMPELSAKDIADLAAFYARLKPGS